MEITQSQRQSEDRQLFRSNSKTLSSTLYQILWDKHFPWSLPSSDVIVQHSDYDEVSAFLRANFSRIFGVDPSVPKFFDKDSIESKGRYYENCADLFAFKHSNIVVATFIGNPVDWSTYYLRHMAILPEFQGFGLYQEFLSYYLGILKSAGVHRVEVDISPLNSPCIHIHAKNGFKVTGQLTTDRWGVTTRYSKFLNPECEDIFFDRFCSGIRSQNPQQGRSI